MTAAKRNITIKQTEAQSQKQEPKTQNKNKHTNKARNEKTYRQRTQRKKPMHRQTAAKPC